jgi:hypothetical protein
MADEVGQFVVGIENLNAGRPQGVIPLNGEEFRRSVYVQVRRSRPLSVLSTFDAPLMEPNCESRSASTVAPQALLLMNNDFVVMQAEHFARRVLHDAGDDPAEQVKRAWQVAFGDEPSQAEQKELAAFLAEQIGHYKQSPPTDPKQPKEKIDPRLAALATLCQALWSANGFLYID